MNDPNRLDFESLYVPNQILQYTFITRNTQGLLLVQNPALYEQGYKKGFRDTVALCPPQSMTSMA
jgi:hypothetical protein